MNLHHFKPVWTWTAQSTEWKRRADFSAAGIVSSQWNDIKASPLKLWDQARSKAVC
ncbi:conserved protein of unknown function [Ralstonia solanacearum CFBP2957]|nr:conserved protein of unknown function [Ralstonia solanacearum CFBP2957]